jgi:hypothetical protein
MRSGLMVRLANRLVIAGLATRLFGDPTKWSTRPTASFGDPRSASPTTARVFAWITAGWPAIAAAAGYARRTDALAYSTRCRRSRSAVPFSTARLSGGPASAIGDRYDCVVPRSILVRVRGSFCAPTSLKRKRPTPDVDQLVAEGRVREGALALRTVSGKPIALATVHESGRARLFLGESYGPSG